MNLFVALVLLLRNSVKWLYFAPQASKRVETAWEGSPERLERSGPQKNLFIANISREKCVRISFKSLRRRRRSRRTKDNPTFWASESMAKAGQHRLPGGREVFGPGVLRPGRMDQSRFESDVTLQVRMYILEYECNGQKNLGESPPRKVNSSGKLPREVRGSRVRGVLPPSRGNFAFFGQFSAKVKKPPPPRIEPATSPTFA